MLGQAVCLWVRTADRGKSVWWFSFFTFSGWLRKRGSERRSDMPEVAQVGLGEVDLEVRVTSNPRSPVSVHGLPSL